MRIRVKSYHVRSHIHNVINLIVSEAKLNHETDIWFYDARERVHHAGWYWKYKTKFLIFATNEKDKVWYIDKKEYHDADSLYAHLIAEYGNVLVIDVTGCQPIDYKDILVGEA